MGTFYHTRWTRAVTRRTVSCHRWGALVQLGAGPWESTALAKRHQGRPSEVEPNGSGGYVHHPEIYIPTNFLLASTGSEGAGATLYGVPVMSKWFS